MREELDQTLCEKYPRIFANRHRGMQETCMCWGFSHGDGWYNIINMLCASIDHHIRWKRESRARDLLRYRAAKKGRDALINWMSSNREMPPSNWIIERCDEILEQGIENLVITPKVSWVVADQVKEKFGTLRFYYHGGDDYVHGMVRMAEAMSAVTCEDCGAPGHQRGGGWIRTLCDHHEAEYKRKQEERFNEYARDQESRNYKFVAEDSGSHD